MKQNTLEKIKWIQEQLFWTRVKPHTSETDLKWLRWAEKRLEELREVRLKELNVEEFL